MPVLYCNISWMKYYAGRRTSDPPLGGGGFPVAEGYCGEECNFVPCDDGFVYGHFEIMKKDRDREVHIERLGAKRTDAFIDDVDIVWTAPKQGKDPRVVVGWSKNARLYRNRQHFHGSYPSAQHKKDEIKSYQVKARTEEVFLVPHAERTMELSRGDGWSGQTSWWYAEDTTNPDAMRFVAAVKAMMKGHRNPAIPLASPRKSLGRKGRAGAATSDAYQRYIRSYEVKIHPRHHDLQNRFKAFLSYHHAKVDFPSCFRDDLRYAIKGKPEVMVEVKPTDAASLRFAIRTAIGQLLDYRQHQQWTGQQLIVVETEVTNADDLRLAFDSGFGLAWPEGTKGFKICWPK